MPFRAEGTFDGVVNADPVTILLIEDDPDQLRVLAAHLSCAGHECVLAPSGEHALEAWCGRSFDLVVTDLRLPGIDGCQLIEHLAHAEMVPVIVVTGFRSDFDHRLRCTPALVVLEKPFTPSRLLAEITAIVAQARGVDQNADHAPEQCIVESQRIP